MYGPKCYKKLIAETVFTFSLSFLCSSLSSYKFKEKKQNSPPSFPLFPQCKQKQKQKQQPCAQNPVRFFEWDRRRNGSKKKLIGLHRDSNAGPPAD
jgi:hypothetical protein